MIFQCLLTVLCLLNVTGGQVHANIAPSPVQQKINVTNEQILEIIDADDLEKFTQIAPHLSSDQIILVCNLLILNTVDIGVVYYDSSRTSQDVKRYYDFLQAVIPYFHKKHFIRYLEFASSVNNRLDVVKLFIEKHFNQFSPNDIDNALSCSQGEVFEYLLPYATIRKYSLVTATSLGNLQVLKKLMPKVDDINSALECAIRYKYDEIVEFLVTAAQDLGLKNTDFDTALKIALLSKNTEKIVSCLLPFCSDVSVALINAAGSYYSQDYLQLILSKATAMVPQSAIDSMFLAILESKSINIEAVKPLFDKYFASVKDPVILSKIVKSIYAGLESAVGSKWSNEEIKFLVLSAQAHGLQGVDFNKALNIAVRNFSNERTVAYLTPFCSDVSDVLINAAGTYCSQAYLELILSKATAVVPQNVIDNMLLAILESGFINIEAVKPLFDKYFVSVQDSVILSKIVKCDYPEFKSYCDRLHPKLAELYNSCTDHDRVYKPIDDRHQIQTNTVALLKKHKNAGRVLNDFCKGVKIGQKKLLGNDGKLNDIVYKIDKIEQDDQKHNRTTLVHGRDWAWNFVNDLWNIICSLKNNQSVITETISLRQRDSNQNIDKLYAYRKKLMQDGVIGSHLVSSTNDDEIENERPERAEVTFMTYTGLSHLDCLPECSMRYFLQNHSATGGTSGYDYAKELIKKHGLEQYADDFEKLAQAHKAASEHGELLVISINNNHLDEIVYPARVGGYRYTDEKASEVTKRLSEQIRTNSQEYMLKQGSPIFCAAALDIPGEDSNKYNIQSITLADDVKHKAYLDQRNALFKKISEQAAQVSDREKTSVATGLSLCLAQQFGMIKKSLPKIKVTHFLRAIPR